ncbi:hypothetical protein HanPI659440_Chr15g0584351 [Helianthus annuus]|nr:hypothetical protein HanPI659440_Chr15g0584351 [Helianthus annuus]
MLGYLSKDKVLKQQVTKITVGSLILPATVFFLVIFHIFDRRSMLGYVRDCYKETFGVAIAQDRGQTRGVCRKHCACTNL